MAVLPVSKLGRIHAFDALRAVMVNLGILYHSAYSFFPNIGPYYFCQDRATWSGFPLLAGVLHGFRMPLFFAMSGFFSQLVLQRKGRWGFLKNRLSRIAAPLLVGAALMPWVDLTLRRMAFERGTLSAAYPGYLSLLIRPLHLWFLYYLLMFGGLGVILDTLGSRFLRARASWVTLVGMTLVTTLILFIHPEPSPAFSYQIDIASLLFYGLFFFFGWGLATEGKQPSIPHFIKYFLLAVPVAFLLFAPSFQWADAGSKNLGFRWVQALLSASYGWLMLFGSLGLVLRCFQKELVWLKLFSRSSYWVYFVHFPIILALQVVFSNQGQSVWIKWVWVVSGTWALSYISYFLLVLPTPLRRTFG